MIHNLVTWLLDFTKPFEVAYDAFDVRIGGGLSQESHSIVYFSKKLNEVKQKYCTYDKKFYAVT